MSFFPDVFFQGPSIRKVIVFKLAENIGNIRTKNQCVEKWLSDKNIANLIKAKFNLKMHSFEILRVLFKPF